MQPASSLKKEPSTVASGQPIEANKFVLPNGLTVVHDEEFAHPVASIQVWVKTGSIHEWATPGAGLSHFVEHMVFKGTDRRPGNRVAVDVQALGGQINAYTSFDRTVYYIDLPAEGAAEALDILADMLTAAQMREEDFKVERDVILREIDMGMDDPSRLLTRAVFSTAFNHHPYRFPVIGHRELFESLSHGSLLDYYRQRYVPGNMVLVVAGAVSREDLETALDASWNTLTASPVAPVFVPEEPAQMAPRTSRLQGDVNVCRGVISFRVPGLAHPDSAVLDVLASIIGGGMSSPLWIALRDQRKLVHAIETMVWNPGSSGLFWIGYTCDSGKGEEVEAAVFEELQNILNRGIDDSEVRKACKQALVADVSARQTMSGLASRLGVAEAIVGDLQYPRRYLDKLSSVTPAQVQEALQRYLLGGFCNYCSLDKEVSVKVHHKVQHEGLPEFQELKLINGARLLMQRDPRIPKVQVRFAGLGGPHYEFSHERGLTSLASTLLTRDTLYRKAEEVAGLAESAGIHFAEFTGNNIFGLAVDCLREDLPLALELLHQGCMAPALHQRCFDREREVQIARIAHDNDELFAHGLRQLRQHFFANHPFAWDSDGDPEALAQLSPRHARSLLQRLMVAPNAVLSVCGDIDPDSMAAWFEGLLLDFPKWHFEPSKARLTQPETTGFLEQHMPREQGLVLLGFPDSGLIAAEHFAFSVLAEILSDMSGPLFSRVREREGLAYYVGASRVIGLHDGMFLLYAGTEPKQVDKVRSLLLEELQKILQDGPPAEVFERARKHQRASILLGRQSAASRANQAALDVLAGRSANHWRMADETLASLTAQHVQDAAVKFLRPEAMLGLTIRP